MTEIERTEIERTEIERQELKERTTRYDTLTNQIREITAALQKQENNPTGSFGVRIAGDNFSMPARLALKVVPLLREEKSMLLLERDLL